MVAMYARWTRRSLTTPDTPCPRSFPDFLLIVQPARKTTSTSVTKSELEPCFLDRRTEGATFPDACSCAVSGG